MLTPPALSLYVHIPWCVQKCPYCDFNSHALKTEIPEEEYISALLEDLDTDIEKYRLNEAPRPLHSIFIGGGTPSLISAEGIERLLKGIEARIPFKPEIEITMEANPGTIEAERFVGYRKAGVTRISIGVQSFEQQKLERLGRIHGQDEAVNAAKLAHQIGLNSFNLDLMHGLPDQNIEQALADLDKAIELAPPHLSWYQLTIEPNTMFYYKPPTLPDDDDLWDIFELGHQKLSAAGYVQYEISGYSKPGYQCQHNLNYWRFGDYIGIGAGAHGKISFPDRITRQVRERHPETYMLAMENKGGALIESRVIEPKDLPFEFMLNTLRLTDGVETHTFGERTGLPLSVISKGLAEGSKKGLLDENPSKLKATDLGLRYLNNLQELFLD